MTKQEKKLLELKGKILTKEDVMSIKENKKAVSLKNNGRNANYRVWKEKWNLTRDQQMKYDFFYLETYSGEIVVFFVRHGEIEEGTIFTYNINKKGGYFITMPNGEQLIYNTL